MYAAEIPKEYNQIHRRRNENVQKEMEENKKFRKLFLL